MGAVWLENQGYCLIRYRKVVDVHAQAEAENQPPPKIDVYAHGREFVQF